MLSSENVENTGFSVVKQRMRLTLSPLHAQNPLVGTCEQLDRLIMRQVSPPDD